MERETTYAEFNREERHYCALLMHQILVDPETARKATAVFGKAGGVSLTRRNLQVFVEAAVLRDYWHMLTKEKDFESQRALLEEAFKVCGADPSLLSSAKPPLWTKGGTRIRYPGQWAMEHAKEHFGPKAKGLELVQDMFRCIPDMLLVCDSSMVLVEAKVESPVDQEQVIRMGRVAKLLPRIPPFAKKEAGVCVLLAKPPRAILRDVKIVTWKELLSPSVLASSKRDYVTLGLRRVAQWRSP